MAPYQLSEYVVGHVARRVADGEGRRVGEYEGRLARPQRVPHRPSRRVAQIDQHAQSVHLPYHRLAERRQSAPCK